LLSGKRFDATEDRGRDRSAYATQPATEVMQFEINLRSFCSREPTSSWHCLAIIDSV
jgi:hypothetical protein